MCTYNCGIDGQGLAFSYIQIYETLKRYHPKLVILDLSPNIFFDPGSMQKLNVLLPYKQKDVVIKNLLTNGSMLENAKFLSKIYPYNGTAYSLISAFIHSFEPDNKNGYVPISGTIDTSKLKLKETIYANDNQFELAKRQIFFLFKIIEECNNNHIKLMLIVSPIFQVSENDKEFIKKLNHLCSGDSSLVQFEDYSNDIDFRYRKNLFQDNLHLNDNGAKQFSMLVGKLIEKKFVHLYEYQ
jgi:hypothetical protein